MPKKIYAYISLLVLILLLFNLSSALQKKVRLILATATTGGTYYPVGVAIATLITSELEEEHNVSMTAITSAGSAENIQLLKNREADLAIIQSLNGSMAWQGKDKYDGSPELYLRSITRLWENVEHFSILSKYAETGNVSDLNNIRKKNFSIGKRGSGTEVSGRVIMRSLGFNPDKDFKLKYLGYLPSANALQNGRIVGLNIPAGPPANAIMQAFATIGAKNLRILEYSDKQLEAINSVYPVWRRYALKAGTYPGQEEVIQTISQPNVLVVHQEIEESVVYEIVKTIYENLSYLRKVHQATNDMTLEDAVSRVPVPLHAGAVRYYREQGIDIPSHLIVK